MNQSPEQSSDSQNTGNAHRVQFGRIGTVICFASLLFCVWAAAKAGTQFLGINLFRQPVLTLEPDRIQLGDVAPNQIVPCVIIVRNTGGGNLVLSAVKGSCDACIRVNEWPREPIAPRQDREIRFQIDTGTTSGMIQKQIAIISNDWRGKPFVLKCSWGIVFGGSWHATNYPR